MSRRPSNSIRNHARAKTESAKSKQDRRGVKRKGLDPKVNVCRTSHDNVATKQTGPESFRVNESVSVRKMTLDLIGVETYKLHGGGESLSIRARVNDIDGLGFPTILQLHVDKLVGHDPMDIARQVRRHLIRLATHEIDEMIVVNGKRVFDPHRT